MKDRQSFIHHITMPYLPCLCLALPTCTPCNLPKPCLATLPICSELYCKQMLVWSVHMHTHHSRAAYAAAIQECSAPQLSLTCTLTHSLTIDIEEEEEAAIDIQFIHHSTQHTCEQSSHFQKCAATHRQRRGNVSGPEPCMFKTAPN